MKKSKLSKSLVTSFIAALALTACGEVTKSDKAIVSFTGADGKQIDVVTEEMFNDYMSGKTHVSSFYDKVLEVLIRNDFEKGSKLGLKTTLNLETIKARAEEDVKKQEELAKSNAKANSRTTGEEWDDILEGEGIDPDASDARERLVQKYIYKYEKEQLEDAFLKANETTLAEQFIGLDNEGNDIYQGTKVTGLPYHISHILVKAENSSNDFTRDTITADQAKLLGNTISTLASGLKTFNGVAAKFSEDSSSDVFGDVGIVANSASANGALSMVSEFQLGIYAFDNILTGRSVASGVKSGLGLDSTTRHNGQDAYTAYTDVVGTIAKVPYEAIRLIGEKYDTEKNESDTAVGSGSASLYPRNILWNKYLNLHNVFAITNQKTDDDLINTYGQDSDPTIKAKKVNAIVSYQKAYPNNNVYDHYEFNGDYSEFGPSAGAGLAFDTNLPTKIDGMPGFVSADNYSWLGLPTGCGAKVLVDEENNVIFGVRSTYGIHLIKIVKSINDFAIKGGSTTAEVSLAEYYTTEVPTYDADGNPNNDKFPQCDGQYKETYVNYIDQEDKSVFTSRAETVESKIKSFDSTSTYMLYEALVDAYPGLKFNKDFDKLIENYIDVSRNTAVINQEENMTEAWASYIELLEAQNEARDLSTKADKKGLVPSGCMAGFGLTDSLTDEQIKALYEKGGACYYGE